MFFETRLRAADSSKNRWSWLDPLIEEIRLGKCPKTIIICKTITMEEGVYHYMRDRLGEDFNSSHDNNFKFNKVSRLHSRSPEEVKEFIESTFVPGLGDNDQAVLVVTILAEQGINFKNARRLIYAGAPGTMEQAYTPSCTMCVRTYITAREWTHTQLHTHTQTCATRAHRHTHAHTHTYTNTSACARTQ